MMPRNQLFDEMDDLIARLNSPEPFIVNAEMAELVDRALEGLKHAKPDEDWAARLAQDVADAND